MEMDVRKYIHSVYEAEEDRVLRTTIASRDRGPFNPEMSTRIILSQYDRNFLSFFDLLLYFSRIFFSISVDTQHAWGLFLIGIYPYIYIYRRRIYENSNSFVYRYGFTKNDPIVEIVVVVLWN